MPFHTTKRIGGKVFRRYGFFHKKKTNAQNSARGARNLGLKARVVKVDGKWAVFARR